MIYTPNPRRIHGSTWLPPLMDPQLLFIWMDQMSVRLEILQAIIFTQWEITKGATSGSRSIWTTFESME